jgi:hypothetical protein
MFIAILFVTFIQINLFGAASDCAAPLEEDLPWVAQQHIQAQAIAYNEQRKTEAIVNLKDDLDLWSLLVYNKTCGRQENHKSLAWVLTHKDAVFAEKETVGADLDDYRTHMELYDLIDDDNDNDINFASWLSTTAQSGQGIDAVRAWALGLERRQTKLTQLHTRLSHFYDAALEDVMPSKEEVVAFILATPGDVLGPLLLANPDSIRPKVEKYVTDTFFPEVEEVAPETEVIAETAPEAEAAADS